MIPKSKGLRISFAGALIFVPSAIGLLVVPPLIATLGMVAGGMMVWGGLIMTLFSFYSGEDQG